MMNPATGRATPGSISEMGRYILELQTKVRKDFTITISWLKAPVQSCVLNVKALVGALKQEKALSVVVKSSTIVRLKL